MGEMSPMMKQYLEIKKNNPDSLLFFRLGDFYEMFFDDAKTASRELGLTLTGRDCGLEERAPMCGVPFHSCEGYIARLIKKGYRVAICEQTEDPKKTKGIVKREIVRVITPGTVTEKAMLEEDDNNYLCSIFTDGKSHSVCFADASTGELHLITFEGDDSSYQVMNELAKFTPPEIILNKHPKNDEIVEFVNAKIGSLCDFIGDQPFAVERTNDTVRRHFGEDMMERDYFAPGSTAVRCVGAVLNFLYLAQLKDIKNITDIHFYSADQYMRLDMSARRNLELFSTLRAGERKGSLWWVMDKTETPMGRRMLRSWLEQPLMSVAAITRRQNAVAELFANSVLLDELRENLSNIFDMERLMTRVLYGTANAPDLLAFSASLEKLPYIKSLLADTKSALLRDVYESIDPLDEIRDLINRAIETENTPSHLRDGGIIKMGYCEELDALKRDMNGGQGIVLEIEARERERTGIKNLKVGFNKVFGYYIEVTNSYKDLVPDDYIRKQTTTNAERYITEELKNLEQRILGAKDASIQMEYDLFCDVRQKVAAENYRATATSSAIARLDSICSLAAVALRNNYVCPVVNDKGEIRIKNGRHPVVETVLSNPFVPNDALLNLGEQRCAVITGPNMAGKSTYMRQVALITVMAQMGSFVPAEEATVGVVDAVFTRVGASDDLFAGQSTFMVEMSEVSSILKNATKNSLLIMDEIGRGTSTYDGVSIAQAVLEYVASSKIGAKTLFATHYHELTELEGKVDGVKNYYVAVKKRGNDITFLRRIVRGEAEGSFGIEVAALAGVPKPVVERAKVILDELVKNNPLALGNKADKKYAKNRKPVEETQPVKEAEYDPRIPTREGDAYYPDIIRRKQEQNPLEDLIIGAQNTLVVEKLKTIDVNTLTPIEALTELNNLVKMVKD